MNEHVKNIRNVHTLLMIIMATIAAFCISPQGSLRYMEASQEAKFLDELDYSSYKSEFMEISQKVGRSYAGLFSSEIHKANNWVRIQVGFTYSSPVFTQWPSRKSKMYEIKDYIEKSVELLILTPDVLSIASIYNDTGNGPQDGLLWMDGCVKRRVEFDCPLVGRDAVLHEVWIVQAKNMRRVTGVVNFDSNDISGDYYAVARFYDDGQVRDYLIKDLLSRSVLEDGKEYLLYKWMNKWRDTDIKLPHQRSLGRRISIACEDIYGYTLDKLRGGEGWKYVNWAEYYPELDRFFPEIRELQPGLAAEYLRTKADTAKRNIPLFGQGVEEGLVYWIGPFILIGMVMFLWAAIKNAVVVAERVMVDISEPWVGLADDWLSKGITLSTIAILPCVLCLAILFQAPIEVGLYHVAVLFVFFLIVCGSFLALSCVKKIRHINMCHVIGEAKERRIPFRRRIP